MIVNYVSEEEFREVMAPLTEALGEYAHAASGMPERNGNLPAATSKAMEELAAEKPFGHRDWLEPVRNAHTFGGILCHFLVENLSALAVVVGTSRVGPTWAYLTQVRVIVETVPVAHWLLDPSIRVEQRIQRGIAYRKDGARYLCKNTSIPNAARSGNKELQRFQRYANATNKLLAGVRESMPASAEGFAAIASRKPNQLHDDALWSYASSTFHGSSWALIQPVLEGRVEDCRASRRWCGRTARDPARA